MRILIAVHTYYPDKNGVQMVTQYIAEGLAKHNDVLVVSNMKDGYKENEVYKNVYIQRIIVKMGNAIRRREKKSFYKIVDDFNPEVLICVCTQSWPFDWMKNKIKQLDCITILYTHGYSALLKRYPLFADLLNLRINAFRYHLKWKIYYILAYKYIAEYDCVIYLSEKNISVWYAQKYNLKNGNILGNAVEDIFFEHSAIERIAAGKCNKDIRFIYVANYDDNKNQLALLRAYYSSDIKSSELIFIGSSKNGYYNKLCEEKNNLDSISGRRNVYFYVGLERAEIPKYLEQADVFVCSSKKEEYPIMLCEAAAKGLPIISFNVGHVSDMDGSMVVGSESEMSKAMSELYYSENERINRGNRLREYAMKNYRICDKVEWLEKKIDELQRIKEEKDV